MAQRLKSWESPRRQGRNDKGKGGSARARQLRKQQQMLRQKLKGSPENKQHDRRGGSNIPPLVLDAVTNPRKEKKFGDREKKISDNGSLIANN
jgi:hypothetical protein